MGGQPGLLSLWLTREARSIEGGGSDGRRQKFLAKRRKNKQNISWPDTPTYLPPPTCQIVQELYCVYLKHVGKRKKKKKISIIFGGDLIYNKSTFHTQSNLSQERLRWTGTKLPWHRTSLLANDTCVYLGQEYHCILGVLCTHSKFIGIVQCPIMTKIVC